MGIVWVANHVFILHCENKKLRLYTIYYLIPLVYFLFLSQIMSILNLM